MKLAETSEVLAVLTELEDFLERYKVRYAPVIADLRRRVARVNATTLPSRETNEVRELFGGMGSLNDVVISRLNGHPVEDEDSANESLERLTDRLWAAISGPEDRKLQ